MTKYIIWAQENDTELRDLYPTITGEHIQENPQIDVDGRYFVGTSRLSQVMEIELALTGLCQITHERPETLEEK